MNTSIHPVGANAVGNNTSLYLVRLEVGNAGTPGAPVLHLDLLVDAVRGTVTGRGMIAQALPMPFGEIDIPHVTGHVHATGLGPYTKVVSLQGDALVPTGDAEQSYVSKFSAGLSIDDAWTGTGGWTLGKTRVEGVPCRAS